MLFSGLSSNGIVFFYPFNIDIRAFMVKMEHNSRVANLGSSYSCINKSFTQFTVFSAILHPLVKSSCIKNITSPTR